MRIGLNWDAHGLSCLFSVEVLFDPHANEVARVAAILDGVDRDAAKSEDFAHALLRKAFVESVPLQPYPEGFFLCLPLHG